MLYYSASVDTIQMLTLLVIYIYNYMDKQNKYNYSSDTTVDSKFDVRVFYYETHFETLL